MSYDRHHVWITPAVLLSAYHFLIFRVLISNTSDNDDIAWSVRLRLNLLS